MSPSFEAFSSLVIKLLWQDKWVIEQRSYRCQNVTTYGSAWFENDVTEISKGFGNDQGRNGIKSTFAPSQVQLVFVGILMLTLEFEFYAV